MNRGKKWARFAFAAAISLMVAAELFWMLTAFQHETRATPLIIVGALIAIQSSNIVLALLPSISLFAVCRT